MECEYEIICNNDTQAYPYRVILKVVEVLNQTPSAKLVSG